MEHIKVTEGSVIVLFIYNYEIVFHVNLFSDRFYYVTNKKEYQC